MLKCVCHKQCLSIVTENFMSTHLYMCSFSGRTGLYPLTDFTLYISWYVCCQHVATALILCWSSVKLVSCSVHTKFSYNPVIKIKVRGIRSGDLETPSYQASPSASV